MLRRPAIQTDPPTFTAGEVERLLHGELAAGALQKWDQSGIFRKAKDALISRANRDATAGTPSRGDRHRRYTFSDLVWMRFFLQVRRELVRRKRASSSRGASRVVQELRARVGDVPPSPLRLLFVGRDVYFVGASGQAECLTRPGQRVFSEFVVEPAVADLRGRVTLLESLRGLARTEAAHPMQRRAGAG
jgi:hypothetical protein